MASDVMTVAVPKNTAALTPYQISGEYFHQTLAGGRIKFPDRCASQVGLRIMDKGRQIAPKTLGSWFLGNDEAIQFDGPYTLEGPPYRLDFIAYNLDPVFQHTLQVVLEFI